jgi:hypothetical protein
MKNTPTIDTISFADSEINTIKYEQGEVHVSITLWNKEQIKLVFAGIENVSCTHLETLSHVSIGAKEIVDEDKIIPVNVYSFLSAWSDKVVLEIVAENHRVASSE